MMESISTARKFPNSTVGPFVVAFCIVMLLFFIDEGYYDFRWMLSGGNWIVFVFYLGVVFTFQWMVSQIFFSRYSGWPHLLLNIVAGLILVFAVSFVFSGAKF